MTRIEVGMVLAAVLAAGGCYTAFDTSADGHGDAEPDTASDTGTDPGHDTAVDPGADTAVDTWTDPVVDPEPDDGPTWCPGPNPMPDGPTLSWYVDDPSGFMDVRIIDMPCMVGPMGGTGTSLSIRLDCTDPASGATESHTIQIDSSTWLGTVLWTGMPVSLSYVNDVIWWMNRYVRVSAGVGGTVLAATDGSDLFPPVDVPGGWYSPLALTMLSGLCPGEDTGCGIEQRLALQVESAGPTVQVFDSNVGWAGMMGDYQVVVDRATMYEEVYCTETPTNWFSVLVAAQADG